MFSSIVPSKKELLMTLLCIALFGLLGCQSIGNVVNVVGLNADLPSLIKEQAKMALYKPHYYMVANSRIGICEFRALAQDINSIANAFDMTEIKTSTLKYTNSYNPPSKLRKMFVEGKAIKVYGVFGRPAKLRCKSGSAFEYMLLFYEPETNDAAIETCYSSG